MVADISLELFCGSLLTWINVEEERRQWMDKYWDFYGDY